MIFVVTQKSGVKRMKNEEAIKILQVAKAEIEWSAPLDYQEAIDMAIEALSEPERKKGKWIDHSDEGYVECPFCHSATNCDGNKDELRFCFSCGAELR